jgi:hypothetical protein
VKLGFLTACPPDRTQQADDPEKRHARSPRASRWDGTLLAVDRGMASRRIAL